MTIFRSSLKQINMASRCLQPDYRVDIKYPGKHYPGKGFPGEHYPGKTSLLPAAHSFDMLQERSRQTQIFFQDR